MAQPVLVLGAASWNRMVHLADLPQGKSATIFDAHETEGAGSTGVGKAFALAALGHAVTLHCALGRDDDAERIIAACEARGIAMLIDWQDAPTPQHLNIMDAQGGRYSIFLSNGAADPGIDANRLRNALASTETVFLSLCASSKNALPLLAGTTAEVLVDLHDYDGANPWYDGFIACADVVQMSDVALEDAGAVARRLKSGRAQQVVVTKGAHGADILNDHGHVHIPICPAKMRDSNGAGDAFSVALWHALQKGMTVTEAGRFAAAAAAFAIEDETLFPSGIGEARIRSRAGLTDA
ncbi:MAG: carbohydrate kinase family protein [Alphaproteobacteria bacterium]|nr:carbohydrate kinase family protein [Alphaproteobacteria bacterium]